MINFFVKVLSRQILLCVEHSFVQQHQFLFDINQSYVIFHHSSLSTKEALFLSCQKTQFTGGSCEDIWLVYETFFSICIVYFLISSITILFPHYWGIHLHPFDLACIFNVLRCSLILRSFLEKYCNRGDLGLLARLLC